MRSRARTLLIVPGDNPGRFGNAVASGADGVILDLEDAVAASEKDVARSHVARWVEVGGAAVIRVNAVGTTWFGDDVAALRDLSCTVMLPKASPESVETVVDALGEHVSVVALVETAAGIMAAWSISQLPQVIRLAFGTGGWRRPPG